MSKTFALAIAFFACVAVCETRAKAPETITPPRTTVGPHFGEINIAASAAAKGGRSSAPEEHESVPHEGPFNTAPKTGGASKTGTKVAEAMTVMGIGLDIATISSMVVLAAVSVVALFYSGRNRDPNDGEPPTRSIRSNSSALPASPESDIVEVSTFAPAITKAEEEVFVQVFFHKLDQTAVVEAQAEVIDPSTSVRGKATLDVEIPRGERIDVILEGSPDLKIDEPHQYLIWRGEPRSCQFNRCG